jgi:putative ABC transport system permease protein
VPVLYTDLKLAGLNLVRERKRTLISLAAIVIGIVGYMLASGFVEWIFWALRESAIDNGLGHIQVSAKGFRANGQSDPYAYEIPVDGPQRRAIAELPGVTAVSPRLLINGLASHGDATVPFVAEGVEPQVDARISKDLVAEGEQLDAASPRGVLLGRGLARALGVERGQSVTFLTSTANGALSGIEGNVRGVFSTGVREYDDVAVRMPLMLAQQLGRTRRVHLWVVGLTNTDRTAEVAREIEGILKGTGKEVSTWLDLSDFYRKTVRLLSRQMMVVSILIAMILVLGIANLLTMSTLERTGEIGTMLAMGTPRHSVLRMHAVEGLLLGVVGGVTGAVIGSFLAALISWIGIPMPPPPGRDAGYRAEILLNAPIVAYALGLALVSAAIGGAYPAWKASRLPIVDALRANR